MGEEEKKAANAEEESESKAGKLREELKAAKEARDEAMKAIGEQRGVLKLQKPLRAASQDITELSYDFTAITGMDVVDAMDAGLRQGPQAANTNLSYRQALNIFARAAAKKTPNLDVRDILEQIGSADAMVGADLARVFFNLTQQEAFSRISRL